MSNKPEEYDVVLGGQNMAPIDYAVLGGIKGVKQRLSSLLIAERIAALSEALNYGEEGLELLLQALNSNDEEINFAAYQFLKHREELEVKLAVVNISSTTGIFIAMDYTVRLQGLIVMI